ncbi:c-type cytochrome [Pelagibacterium mangrovi]|uniref:c-type cytochrome n=1 Tax=Pelagibacterium mangrovi TaxID=3119828 RepID=UPI002FC9C1E7
MLDSIGLRRLGRTVLVAAGIAALAGTSVAFDNMSAEQRAALEVAQAEANETADEAGSEDAAADAGGERTIFDGVYTAAQAERGQGFFGSDCASCHSNTARGSSAAPGLIGYTLDNKYADRPLFDYYDYMRANMPPGNAGWFTDQEYADIVAYLLQLHGAPEGDTELEGTDEALAAIMVVPTP